MPKQAVDQPVEITMNVTGHTLSDRVVIFEPAGLVFLKDAELYVLVGRDRVDMDLSALTVYHQYGDGTVEPTGILDLQTNSHNNIEVTAAVPGFSRYGLRGGW